MRGAISSSRPGARATPLGLPVLREVGSLGELEPDHFKFIELGDWRVFGLRPMDFVTSVPRC